MKPGKGTHVEDKSEIWRKRRKQAKYSDVEVVKKILKVSALIDYLALNNYIYI